VTAAAPAVAVPRVLVWRHGRTAWNAEGRFQGQLDPPLDQVGRDQAARSGAQLAALLPPEGTVVVSSDLQRAAATAAALVPLLGVPLRVDPRLRELDLGSWQGLTRQEVAERHPGQYADWVAGRPVLGRGSEEPDEVAHRALAALGDVPAAEVVVLVTHGGTGLRLIEALLGLGRDRRRLLGSLGNCAWSELLQQSGRWRLVRHNQSVDLPVAAGPAGRTAVAGEGAIPVGADGRAAADGRVGADGHPGGSSTDADAVL
jgi:glucosyl-3-phosphoglycerate phosphatase